MEPKNSAVSLVYMNQNTTQECLDVSSYSFTDNTIILTLRILKSVSSASTEKLAFALTSNEKS